MATYMGIDFGYQHDWPCVIVMEVRGSLIYVHESDIIETRGLTIPEKQIVLEKHRIKIKDKYPGIIEL